MTSTGVARTRRQRSAYAIKAAAKQRRQRNIAIVLGIVFVIVAAYEIPHTIKLFTKHNDAVVSTPAVTTTPTTPQPAPSSVKLPKVGSDPFTPRTFSAGDSTVGAAIGGRDPFANPAGSPVPVAPTAASQPLPQTIVIGTPGSGKTAVHGWIVILASIPTGEGRAAAATFASKASGKVGSLSILNSSNRQPLRGGYWVVYAGPFSDLAAVTTRASAVHSAGYGSAYIRQLIIYK